MYFLNSCRIYGHFDTKFTTIPQIEQILQESKDPKIDHILNLERVYFLMTRVIIHAMIGCLLVGKVLGLFDNTYQISIQIFVHTS